MMFTLGFIVGFVSLALLRHIIFGLVRLTIKRGERMLHEGELLADKRIAISNELKELSWQMNKGE